MTKRLLLLNGLACLMVPFHHATAFTLDAMIRWRYTLDPTLEQDFVGSFAYYLIMVIRQVDSFAIPAFLFVSGYFVSFMVRGRQTQLKLSMVMPRIKVLLVPFFLWTVVRYGLLMQYPTSVEDILSTYYYVPLVIQLYFLSPILIPMAKKNWKLLLIIAAVLQLGTESLRYFSAIGLEVPGLGFLMRVTPLWFFPRRIMYFVIGAIAGIYVKEFKEWVTQYKWWLLGTVVATAVLSIVEYELVAYLLGREWLGPNFSGIGRIAYATTFSICFLAFEDVAVPYAKQLNDLAMKSLGVYLINTPAIYVVGTLIYHFAPTIYTSMPLLYFVILTVAGLAIPIFLMELVRKTPAKAMYRYAFG